MGSKCFIVIDHDDGSEYVHELQPGEPLLIGRTESTRMTSSKLSRVQVKVSYVSSSRVIEVTRLGANASWIATLDADWKSIGKNETVSVGEHTTVWLLKDQYPVHVFFE